MKFLYSIITFFSLSFCLFAQDIVIPKQEIVGGSGVIPLAELVELSLSDIEKKPEHFKDFSVSWKVLDGNKEKVVRPYGNTVVFVSGIKNTELTALASVSYLYVIKDKDGKYVDAIVKNKFLSCKISVGGKIEPDNPPDPKPNPNTPDPKFEFGKFGLSKITYDYAVKVLDKNMRSKACEPLSRNMAGIAASIAAGAFTKLDDILKNAKEANDDVIKNLNLDLKDWNKFGELLQEDLYKLYTDKKMKTPDDFRDAFNEIAFGLLEASKR